MIDFYTWDTPNGFKVAIALEEMALSYRTHLVDIVNGDQFDPAFLAISPNNKIPAIVDHDGPDHSPISVFESGAILLYLARKTGKFIGRTAREQVLVEEWLMWQMGGLGPIAGQAHYFLAYAPKANPPQIIPHAQERFHNEVTRLYQVLNKRLSANEFVAGAQYTIADMAIFGWVMRWQRHEHDLNTTPHVKAWFEKLAARPAVQRGLQVAKKTG